MPMTTTGNAWSATIFPTPVGMDPVKPDQEKADKGFPHTRGDGPDRGGFPCLIFQFSPHPWGWTDEVHIADIQTAVFPTPVGMDLTWANEQLLEKTEVLWTKTRP